MNRLIIIGNGFDLAHGIKTSYKDFIANYFFNVISRLTLKNFHEDDLIRISLKQGQYYHSDPFNKLTPDIALEIFKKILTTNNTIFNLNFKSELLKNSFDKIDKFNWVDLEIEYFNVLLKTKNNHKDDIKNEAIKKINQELDYLKAQLCEYLFEQESLDTNVFNTDPLIDCFTEIIKAHEIVTSHNVIDHKPSNLFFLNFNYTKTFEKYLKDCVDKINTDYNYIHGSLGGIHGDPIFGFGDELDKRYLEFEDERNNELFKHIKSFEYLKNKNYYRLIRFIESEDYQVQIYGHSCGLSDRTMLNQIFEHENCKSIKIFYHQREDGTNDYTEKTYEISRHFKDKGMMRKKIVPLDFSRPMPQPMNLK